MKLTNYFIKKKVRSLASQAAGRKHEFRALGDAGHILVLYEACDQELVTPHVEELRRMHKKVLTCIYTNSETVPEPEAADAEMVVHARKDLDIWQVPSAETVRRFNALDADMIIDLTHADCYPMQFLMLQHPCKFKAGVKHAGIDLYDLSIALTEREDIGHLFGHILFYLQAIRSK